MDNYLDLNNEVNFDKLIEPARIIKDGGIVVFPTETVYGIGANCLDEQAIKKLYKIKQRPISKPISLLVSDMQMIKKVAKDISNIEYKLMDTFFPGPFTIILNKKNIVPDIVSAGENTIGVRMPKGDIARKLVEYVGVPIATSSANISGKPSGTNLKEIIKEFEGKVNYYIDGGESEIGIPSTVVKVINNKVEILREGSITKEKIEEVLDK